jgi:hypothetical protein
MEEGEGASYHVKEAKGQNTRVGNVETSPMDTREKEIMKHY